MGKRAVLSLEIGQLAEMKTFEEGYRGAWFRCKITDIHLKKNKIKPEYYDFTDEEIKWAKIYEVPPYGRKLKQIRKQLMVRPHFPVMYYKSEMPPVNSISQVCVVVDGTWKVEDLVDWHKDDCYWSARVINVLSDDKVQIELPMAPAGEGGTHEAFCKDLRPSLDWSPRKGWTLPTVEGQSSSSAQLIFPSKQGMDSEVENASSGSRISVVEGDIVESSESISNLSVEAADEENIDYATDLNIMHEETLEAAIVDLEELANKIKWIKSLLHSNQSPTNQTTSWKFV